SSRLGELQRLLAEPSAQGSAFVELYNGIVLSNAVVASATNFVALTSTIPLLVANQAQEQVPMQQVFNANPSEILWQNRQAQGQRSSDEFQARAYVYQQAAQAGINANYGNQAVPVSKAPSRLTPDMFIPQGPITPVWLGSTL